MGLFEGIRLKVFFTFTRPYQEWAKNFKTDLDKGIFHFYRGLPRKIEN